jgi:Fatty acid hydroxylase superfamily
LPSQPAAHRPAALRRVKLPAAKLWPHAQRAGEICLNATLSRLSDFYRFVSCLCTFRLSNVMIMPLQQSYAHLRPRLSRLPCGQVPALYRAVHAKHHTKAVVRASDALRLSAVEQAIDVGCSIAAVNLVGAHPLSRSVYNLVIVWLIVELHSGWDLPWQLQNVVPLDLWGGSRRHDAHHARGNVCYQKFFTYLDNALGTVEDASATARRARGRNALRERVWGSYAAGLHSCGGDADFLGR